MVPVTRLPELALLCVFKQLPLADQMSARQVCTRWAVLVPESTRRMRSLTLFVGAKSLAYFEEQINLSTWYDPNVPKVMRLLINEDGTPMYPTHRLTEWNSLQYGDLDDDTVDQIVATFTGITKFQFAACATDSSYEHLVTMLGHWCHQLTTFKLYFIVYIHKPFSADLTNRLFAAFNAMSVLKSLVLDLAFSENYRDLSVLSQLVDITISLSASSARLFLDSLQRQVAQDNTTLLRINANVHPSDIQLFTSLSDHLRARFVSLSLWAFPITALESICTLFRSLTYLKIDFPVSFRHLFTNLSRLTELIYLGLYISFTRIEADHLEHLLLPQVKSIKSLTLWMTVSTHLELSQLHLAWTMPNLQVIFINCSCTTCRICVCSPNTMKADLDKAKKCLRQILGPLKRDCLKLRHILHRNEDILGTAEELLAE